MPKFRVDKKQNFTIISNSLMRDRDLSNKALGLLVRMLSLPPDWDYTQEGLASICHDGKDGIASQLKELEAKGYLVRNRMRGGNGKFSDMEYIVYEECQKERNVDLKPFSPEPEFPVVVKPVMEKPSLENPEAEKPAPVKPPAENPPQLSTYILSNKELSTNVLNINQSIPQQNDAPLTHREPEVNSAYNIDYEMLENQYGEERVAEIKKIIDDVLNSIKKFIRVGKEDKPVSVVKAQFNKITEDHIGYVFDSIDQSGQAIKNIKAYLITSLYDAPNTINNYYQSKLNQHLHKRE